MITNHDDQRQLPCRSIFFCFLVSTNIYPSSRSRPYQTQHLQNVAIAAKFICEDKFEKITNVNIPNFPETYNL